METPERYRVEHPEGGYLLIDTTTGKWVCHTASIKYFKTRCDALSVPFEVPARPQRAPPAPRPPRPPRVPPDEYRKAYYQAHKEEYMERNRRAREHPGNRERQAELCRIRYHENLERERARCREYRYRRRKALEERREDEGDVASGTPPVM